MKLNLTSLTKLVIFIFVHLFKESDCDDHYTESLVVKPLADGHLYAFFEFKTVWDKDVHSINWGII